MRPAAWTAGSSPLTRGAHPGAFPHSKHVGLIPAHAGSTCLRCARRPGRGAHPRSRGEHEVSARRGEGFGGSSPLTRGALPPESTRQPPRRLIPAHAGSTGLPLSSIAVTRAHPRSRGEHCCLRGRFRRLGGSSPLTRGARRGIHCGQPRHRLIPAHAGSTELEEISGLSRGAHPRSRGEHPSSHWMIRSPRGSSPLTRGAHRFFGGLLRHDGLIPAHAGST